jgi:hypothetical protein
MFEAQRAALGFCDAAIFPASIGEPRCFEVMDAVNAQTISAASGDMIERLGEAPTTPGSPHLTKNHASFHLGKAYAGRAMVPSARRAVPIGGSPVGVTCLLTGS